MSNSIDLIIKYSTVLGELWVQESKTGSLETPQWVKETKNAHEISIPQLSMDGLGDYSRNDGYANGSVSLMWETVSYDYERGRMFSVDALDNEETMDIAFGKLAGEFMRGKVVPELDAYRFAELCAGGVGKTESIANGAGAIAALRTGTQQMDDAEVPAENRVLFITPLLMGLIEDMDTIKSKAVLSRFSDIITVPQSRFMTEVTLLDGRSPGETSGGFVRGEDGTDINFMIVHKSSLICFTKHAVSKVITPEQNQTSDSWKFGFRTAGYCTVMPGKSYGVYTNHK